MLELYEGKVTVDLTNLSDVARHHLVGFKEELNKYIKEKTEGKNKKPVGSNIDHHRQLVNGGGNRR